MTLDEASTHAQRIHTLAWLAKQPIAPIDDLTARRHSCVTDRQHSGWLQDVCDLTHEAVSESGSLSGLLWTIGRGIPRLPIIFQGPQEIASTLVGDDSCAGMFKRILPREEVAKLLYWGITIGVVPIERVRLTEGRYTPGTPRPTRSFRVWEPRALRYEWSSDRWLLSTAAGDISIADAVDNVDGRRIFSLWTPYDSSRPWRLAPWRWLSLMAILSRDAMYARARHIQVLSPKRVVEYTEFWSEPQRQKMEAILDNSTYNQWLMLPPGAKYSIANVGGNDITTVYQNIIDWARGEAEIGIFGQKVTTEGNKGFSDGDIFRDTAAGHIQFYADSAAEFLSEQVIDPWVDDCYGNDVGDVSFVWDVESADRKAQKATALGNLGESFQKLKAGADALGLDVDLADAIRVGRENGIRLMPRQQAQPAAQVPNAA